MLPAQNYWNCLDMRTTREFRSRMICYNIDNFHHNMVIVNIFTLREQVIQSYLYID